jgi:hypothetical protein
MRAVELLVLLLALAELVSAQTSADKPPAAKSKESAKLVSLVGCVASNPSAPGEYTIVDKDSGTYRLTGTDMRGYVGRQVQVTGGPKRFHIAGGLLPTPNAAAQAGAVDPTPAAAAPTAARGTGPAPEFRVKSVKPVAGTCLP